MTTRLVSRVLLCALGAYSGMSGMAAADESVLLKPRFPKGESFYVESHSKGQQTIESSMMPGGKIETTFEGTNGAIFKGESESKSGVEVSLTFDREAMHFNHPMMGDLGYDSDLPDEDEAPPFRDLLSPLLGKRAVMTFDADMNPKSFHGMADIFKEMENGGAPNPFAAFIKPSMADDVQLITWGHGPYLTLPNRPVKVGEKWQKIDKQRLPQIGDIVLKLDCRLEGVGKKDGRRIATIKFTGALSADPNGKPPAAVQGMQPKFGGGTIEGTTLFDVDQGRLVKYEHSGTQKTTMSMPGQGEDEKPDAEKSDKDGKDSKQKEKEEAPADSAMKVSASTTLVVMAYSIEERSQEKAAHVKESKEKAASAPDDDDDDGDEKDD